MHFDEDRNEVYACNKYTRCLTYEEQQEKIRKLTRLVSIFGGALTYIVQVNGMDYEYKAWAKAALSKMEMGVG